MAVERAKREGASLAKVLMTLVMAYALGQINVKNNQIFLNKETRETKAGRS
ncbi:MAG: hypothetical protein AB1641_12260 [Thermodesulfobacteriota bacterium]